MTSIETSEQDDCVEHRMCGFRPEWQLHDTHQHVARIVRFQNQSLTDLAAPVQRTRMQDMASQHAKFFTQVFM